VNAPSLIAIFAGAAALSLLAAQRRRLTGTTLLAPWGWAVACLTALVTAEIWAAAAGGRAADPTGPGADPLRFTAAMLLVCPAAALLGAKRPQSRGWQFVVLALLAVLVAPVAENWFSATPRPLVLAGFRALLVVVLIGIGLANGVATRYRFSVLLAGAGQVLITAPLISWWDFPLSRAWAAAVGLALLAASLLLTWLGWPRPKSLPLGLDRLWRDFRDLYGVVWTLRVAERVNATAAHHNFATRLSWSGFQPAGGEGGSAIPAKEAEAIGATLRSILRRFVSREWIQERLGQAASDPPRSVRE